MSKQGQYNIKGVNAQAWAAMSLFLQYVKRSDFRYIGFEGDKLEDFYLVFEDGRKIICESKDSILNYSDIREILDKIHKHGQVTKRDEIVIICKGVNASAKNDIENYKYFQERVKEKLIKKPHNFKEQHLNLLQQLKFWKVPKEMNEKIVELLVAKLLQIWVPKHTLEEIRDHLVKQEVYDGSATGKTLTGEDFLGKLDKRKTQILEDAGYEKERQTAEKDIKALIEAIDNPDKQKWANNKISELSNFPSEFYFVLMKLKDKQNLNLRQWDNLWEASVKSAFSVHLFQIFENNLATKDNQKYSLDFAGKVLEDGSYNFFREEFIKTDIARMCQKILDLNPKYNRKVFEIIKNLFNPSISDFFYTEKGSRYRDDKWEREEISKLLTKLYQDTKDGKLKEDIIEYLSKTFNLVEDHGEYWHYTPTAIFEIFRDYVIENPEERVIWFKELCVEHYNNFYGRFRLKWKFDGWDLAGGGISQSGSNFSILDNHFVRYIIKPALQELYKNKEKGWDFIIKNCVARKINDVSSNKPDFLNRASIPVLFVELKSGKHNAEAFDILSDFVRMRKGIPWKADLIFQELRGDYTKEQKWALIKVSLDEYKNLPVNVFVEQITSDLAAGGYKEAADIIASWITNPEYHKRQTIGSFNVMGNISKLLDNPETFDEGVKIFKNYITSDEFVKKDDDWETWEVAKNLAKIIAKDLNIGVNILKEVNTSKSLTLNQQILSCSSINDLPKENKEALQGVYKDFVTPFLQDLDNDISKIEKRITNRHSREQIVQFAEKLAEAKLFDDSLYIVNIFINDSDPIFENYPDDPDGTFNRHQKIIGGEDDLSIGSVRGYCAWVLQKFATLYGRDYIPTIIPLVEKLTKDQNYYVRLQSCIPLLELVKNRNTVLPDNRKERFLPVEISKSIENVAFSMLRDPVNHKLPAIMKHLAMVFTYMRSIDQKRAYEVLQIFLKDEYPKKDKQRGHESYLADVLSEAAPLYIFFAEYRTQSFKDWPKDWEPLGKFDDRPFKKLLVSLVKSDNSEIKQIFAWQMVRIPHEVKDTPKFKDSIKLAAHYLEYMTAVYDHRTFENIYRFIEDYIEESFDVCFDLWKKCIGTESQYFRDNYTKDNLSEMYWWPFFYNGKILVKIAQVKGNQEFLDWFKKLVDYPIDLLVANDLDVAVEYLTSIKTHREEVEKLFARLMERNPKYYDYKQKWSKILSGKSAS